MNQKELIDIPYDKDLLDYLRLTGLEYRIQNDTHLTIYTDNIRYIWIVAVNFGRYLEHKENQKKYKP